MHTPPTEAVFLMEKRMDFVGAALRLTDQDILNAADEIEVSEASIRAVVEIEARDRGFSADGRPIILFEPHVFYRELGVGPKRDKAVAEDLASARWNRELYPGSQGGRYEQLEKAIKIDREAALKSTSWGMGQVMGFNFAAAGYSTVEEFVAGMMESEGLQLMAMVGFIKTNRLARHLRSKDWASFAKGYNGSGYRKNRYDEKLAAAYAKHRQKAVSAPDEALNPALAFDPEPFPNVVYKNQSATRNQRVTSHLERLIHEAVLAVFGDRVVAHIYSGGQDRKGHGGRRTGSVRHDNMGQGGRAADIRLFHLDKDQQVIGAALAPLVQYWLASKNGACGALMGAGGVHVDQWTSPPKGGGMSWTYSSLDGKPYRDAIVAAIDAGRRGHVPNLAVESDKTFSIGQRDAAGRFDITLLQRELADVGYPVGDIDGIFGKLTRDAFMSFQADNGLPSTGAADPATIRALGLAKPRNLARENHTADDLRDKGSSTVKAADDGKIGIGVTGVGGAIVVAKEALDASENVIEVAEEGGQLVERFFGLGMTVVAITLIAAGGWFAYRRFGHVIEARLEDHRSGRNRGR